MSRRHKQIICRNLLLGAVLLLAAWLLTGLPRYSLMLAHQKLAASYMVEPQLLEIYRPTSDSFRDAHQSSGKLYSYVLSMDDINLYCARFMGSSNPFHGLFHLGTDSPISLGGYRNGTFTAAVRGARTTAVLPPDVATINHEGRCFIHNADPAACFAEVRLRIHEAEGTVSFALPRAERDGDIFPCILYAHTADFHPTIEADALWLHRIHIVLPKDGSAADLQADLCSAYIRAIGEGRQRAQVEVTFLDADRTALYTDTYTLNPDADGIW